MLTEIDESVIPFEIYLSLFWSYREVLRVWRPLSSLLFSYIACLFIFRFSGITIFEWLVQLRQFYCYLQFFHNPLSIYKYTVYSHENMIKILSMNITIPKNLRLSFLTYCIAIVTCSNQSTFIKSTISLTVWYYSNVSFKVPWDQVLKPKSKI